MSEAVRELADPDAWNTLVDRSDGATPFHRFAALEAFAESTNTELHALVARADRGPIGLFPVFERSIGPVSVAFSPPPNRKITYLGPVLLDDPGLDCYARECLYKRFVESVLRYVDRTIDPRYVNVRMDVSVDDPRPFVWNGFESIPRYTYEVDLEPGPDDLIEAMGSDLRSNVRNTDESAYEITIGGLPEAEQVIRHVARRHEELDASLGVTPSFVRRLYRAIPEAFTVYVCRVDDSFVGGSLILSDDTTVYRWQSFADFESDVPVQDLLDWRVITDACENGFERYDLVGANNPRLCEYKAKFAPELRMYYRVKRSGPVMGSVAAVYSLLR